MTAQAVKYNQTQHLHTFQEQGEPKKSCQEVAIVTNNNSDA